MGRAVSISIVAQQTCIANVEDIHRHHVRFIQRHHFPLRHPRRHHVRFRTELSRVEFPNIVIRRTRRLGHYSFLCVNCACANRVSSSYFFLLVVLQRPTCYRAISALLPAHTRTHAHPLSHSHTRTHTLSHRYTHTFSLPLGLMCSQMTLLTSSLLVLSSISFLPSLKSLFGHSSAPHPPSATCAVPTQV